MKEEIKMEQMRELPLTLRTPLFSSYERKEEENKSFLEINKGCNEGCGYRLISNHTSDKVSILQSLC